MIYLKGESWQKHVLQNTPNRSLETIPRYLLLYSFSTLLHKAFEIKEFIHSLNSQMKFAKQKRAKTWQFQKKKTKKLPQAQLMALLIKHTALVSLILSLILLSY